MNRVTSSAFRVMATSSVNMDSKYVRKAFNIQDKRSTPMTHQGSLKDIFQKSGYQRIFSENKASSNFRLCFGGTNQQTGNLYHAAMVFQDAAPILLAPQIIQRFEQGCKIVVLGCSSGHTDVVPLALLLANAVPEKADRYPIVGVDIHPEVIKLAKLHLLDAVDYQGLLGYQKHVKKTQRKNNFNMDELIAPVEKTRIESEKSLILKHFRSVLHQAKHSPVETVQKMASDAKQPDDELWKKYAFYQLDPSIQKRIRYKVEDLQNTIQQLGSDVKVVMVDNVLYQMRFQDMMNVIETLYEKLQPGSLLTISSDDLGRGYDQLVMEAGFKPVEPLETIFIRP